MKLQLTELAESIKRAEKPIAAKTTEELKEDLTKINHWSKGEE